MEATEIKIKFLCNLYGCKRSDFNNKSCQKHVQLFVVQAMEIM